MRRETIFLNSVVLVTLYIIFNDVAHAFAIVSYFLIFLASTPQFLAHGIASLLLGFGFHFALLVKFARQGILEIGRGARLFLQFRLAAQSFRHGLL